MPTDWPGVEIHRLDTIGDERTNITDCGDVRLPDRCRVGPANEGGPCQGQGGRHQPTGIAGSPAPVT